MQSILEEFAYGNVVPEAQTLQKDPQYGRATELVLHLEQSLRDRLDAADRDLFEKYVCAQEEAARLLTVKQLVYGYKLGLTMTAEAFLGMNDLYLGGEEL